MTGSRRYGWRSLRFKLVLASVVIEALMLTALVWNSTRITGNAMQEIFQDRVETLTPLLNVSLANPLVQRDYATLEERLKTIVNRGSLVYVEVRDELGQLAASHGTVPEIARFDTSFEVSDHIYNQTFDITLAGQVVGRARYGINVSLLHATLASLRNQGALVATTEIVLTILLLATLGALLTRHLRTLAQAAGKIAGGDYKIHVPAVGRDEVADAAQAFNAMADTLARDLVERKQAERELRESEERFRATFEQAAVGIAQVASDGRWLHVNQKLCDIVGYSREELLQRSFQDITYPDDLNADLAFVRRMLAGEIQTYSMEKRYIRKDGSLIWIYLTVGLVRQPTGEPKYFISVVEDITARRHAQEALQQSEQRIRDLIDGMGPQMFVGLLTLDGVIIEANRSALAAAGLKPEDVQGKPVEETYWWSHSKEVQQQLREAVMRAARGEASRYDVQIRVADNQFIILDFSIQPLRDETGRVVFLVPSAMVITERKLAEEGMQRLAYRDPLTDLPNRAALQERLRVGLAEANTKHQSLALLIVDLNDFRDINDTLGHPTGDQVLMQVAARLKEILWESDMVARLAGDEFAVLLPRLANHLDIGLVVRKVVEGFKRPFVVAEIPLDVQPSIGVALYPKHGTDADTLFQRADVALNVAKMRHQTHIIYDTAVDHYDPLQLRLMADLREAIPAERLTLYYQPKIAAQTGRVIGMEALVRWPHETRGMISPDQFIPMAEHTGLINPLTTWVLGNALRQTRSWRRVRQDFSIAVNISARNLQQADIVTEIQDLVHGCGIPPAALTLEVTESAVMIEPERARAILGELRAFGVRISIDDFGIGYSSLAYLKDLPADQIKIDKSFVMGFKDKHNAAIVRSIIELAHNLGLEVTAEGVEDETTLKALKTLSCDVVQGYYIGRPMPVAQIGAWFESWSEANATR